MIYFGTAKTAGDKYKTAYEEESNMSGVTINGKEYGSIEEYMEEVNPTIVEPDNIDDWKFEPQPDGSITITLYGGPNTEVVFPNYVNGKPVKTIKQTRQVYAAGMDTDVNIWASFICDGPEFSNGLHNYHMYQKTITKVKISNGIQSIGNNIFLMSNALEKVEIPSSVINIGDNAFGYCQALTEITIPSSVTTMGSNVFNNIPSIIVHVPWKEGEKPEGWDDGWNKTNSNCIITVDYAK